MPVLLSDETVTLDFADLTRRVPITRPALPPVRAAGIHQSEILAYIARKVGWLKEGERDEEEYPLLWGLGCAWEEWVFSMYPEVEWQPGEVTVDGISGNADGVSWHEDTEEAWLEEGKLTFKASAPEGEFIVGGDKKWKMWEHQAREYCWCYGTRVVRWHVCHVRGDYKEFGPVYRRYVVQFSDQECSQTHGMLMKWKAEAEAWYGKAA